MWKRFSLSEIAAMQLLFSVSTVSAAFLALSILGSDRIQAAPGRLAEPLDGETTSLPAEEADTPKAPAGHVDLYGDPLEAGAIARLGTLRYRHPGWYKKIELLPDSKTVVVGTHDNTVRYWDATSGKMVHEFELGDDRLDGFRLSPDGKLLVIMSYDYPRDHADRTYQIHLDVWGAKSRLKIQRIEWKDQSPSAAGLAISPDGKFVATASQDRSIRIWKRATSEVFVKLNPQQQEIESLDFSPAGGLLAIAGFREVSLWSYETNQQPRKLVGLPQGGQVVRFSPDGSILAVGSNDDTAARLYDAASSELIRILRGNSAGYYREGLCFSADGKQLVVPANHAKTVEIFDVKTGKLERMLDADVVEPRGAAISADGRYLACIGSEAAIQVWDLETGKRISDRFVGHHELAYDIRFSNDGSQVVTGGPDGTARVWDSATGRQVRMLQHDRWVAGLDVSSDSEWIASCGLGDSVRLWEFATGREKYRLPGHGGGGGNSTTEVAFSPDGEQFYSFGSDLNLRSYSVRTGRILAEHAIRPSGIEIEENEEGKLRLANAGPMGGRNEIFMELNQALICPEPGLLLLGGRTKGTIYLFDIESGREIDKVQTENQLQTFLVSSDGNLFVSVESKSNRQPAPGATPNRTYALRLRNLQTKELVGETPLQGSFASKMAISRDGTLIAVSQSEAVWTPSTKYGVDVYDTEELKLVARIGKITQRPHCLEFSPDGNQLAASCADSTVTIWDVKAFDADGLKE